jgi:hypothetical protein
MIYDPLLAAIDARIAELGGRLRPLCVWAESGETDEMIEAKYADVLAPGQELVIARWKDGECSTS